MAEAPESSRSKLSDEVWAKLVLLNSTSRHSDIEIRSEDTRICREVTSDSSLKYIWLRITRNSDRKSATIQNTSLNAILVDEVVVREGCAINIRFGAEIVFGCEREGHLSYGFKIITQPTSRKQLLQIPINSESAKWQCYVCKNVWHDVVTAAPCLHNFCNGCFSASVRESRLQKHPKAIVGADPSLRRSDGEIALLNSRALIQSNLVIRNGSKWNQKRPRAPGYVERVDSGNQCPQCVAEICGYHCDPNAVQAHLQCQLCGGIMPFRVNLQVLQHCMGCDRPFCGAYWNSQNVTPGDLPEVCHPETLKPISQRTFTRIPFATHHMNFHEQDITRRCIVVKGQTLQDVITEWAVKLDRKLIDSTEMPLNHAEMITSSTHLCHGCSNLLVGFLLYMFRITLQKSDFPADAAQREDCSGGYLCHSQHVYEEHARKYNHVCRPT